MAKRKKKKAVEKDIADMWLCQRLDRLVCKITCEACKTDERAVKHLRKEAASKGIKHAFKPCTYECKIDTSRPIRTEQESIYFSHWKDYR